MVWLPDDEKNFEDIFIRFDRMYERDRQTHRQTPHDDIGRAYASQHRAAKNCLSSETVYLVDRERCRRTQTVVQWIRRRRCRCRLRRDA